MIYEQIAQTKAFNYIKSNAHNTNKSQENNSTVRILHKSKQQLQTQPRPSPTTEIKLLSTCQTKTAYIL